ncbi:hypothetical protein GDO86_005563, partial [Hymenochirus boettgeri]
RALTWSFVPFYLHPYVFNSANPITIFHPCTRYLNGATIEGWRSTAKGGPSCLTNCSGSDVFQEKIQIWVQGVSVDFFMALESVNFILPVWLRMISLYKIYFLLFIFCDFRKFPGRFV